jgi:DNA-binding transcriptional MerR regulator
MSEKNLNKTYFTIGEISERFDLENHVLRYWEKEFPALNPVKRSGIRYYQNEDIKIIGKIKDLLYNQGFTIKGAKAQFAATTAEVMPNKTNAAILDIIRDLEDIRNQLGA